MDKGGSKYDGCDTLYTYEATHLLDRIRDFIHTISLSFSLSLSLSLFFLSIYTSQVVRIGCGGCGMRNVECREDAGHHCT